MVNLVSHLILAQKCRDRNLGPEPNLMNKIEEKKLFLVTEIDTLTKSLQRAKDQLKKLQTTCKHKNKYESQIPSDYYSKGYTKILCKDCGLGYND
jgi:hypothetical protein